MMHRVKRPLLFAAYTASAVFTFAGCALTSKAELVRVRYFSPEQVTARADSQLSATASSLPLEVKLGRVSSGPNLRERIAYRESAYELGYYEDLQWTERPETYVRRELARALFETRNLKRVLGGSAPTLDVELISFEDLRQKASREVRIQVKLTLYLDNDVLREETLTIDRPVPGENPHIETVVATMATALDATVAQVVMRVEKVLLARRSLEPTAATP
jgi:ABC-type uncharacterized transport system auxiliary subunit